MVLNISGLIDIFISLCSTKGLYQIFYKFKGLIVMIKVLTYGTFDLLHHGHIRLLERSRALGDHLTVAVSTDQFNLGKGKMCAYTYEERVHILQAIRYVDDVIPEENWEQKIEDVKKYDIDIFVIGDDWEGEFDFLKEYCQVLYLPRTPDISTTKVKEMLAAR